MVSETFAVELFNEAELFIAAETAAVKIVAAETSGSQKVPAAESWLRLKRPRTTFLKKVFCN